MENLELPPELERLEHYLAGGPRPMPSAALRQRVLGDMRRELYSERMAPRWRAAACAAVVLAGLGLSLGVLHTTGFAMQQSESPPSIDDVAWRLRQLSPNLSREDSLRQAVLRQITARESGTILSEPTTP